MKQNDTNAKTGKVFAQKVRSLTPQELESVAGGDDYDNNFGGPKDGGGTDNQSRRDRI